MDHCPTTSHRRRLDPIPALRRRSVAVAALAAVVVAASAAAGCSTAPATTPGAGAATDGGDDSVAAIDIIGGDVQGASDATASDTGLGDAFPADTDAPDGTGNDAVDSGWADDLGSGLPFDVQTPDVPYVALQVLSTAPKTDTGTPGLKAVFSVTFSQPVNDQSIADYTVLVIAATGATIAGAFKVQGPVLSFVSDAPLPPASRVDVTITIQVQGHKGQTLAEAYSFHFHTAGYGKTEPYSALALRYAPEIRQGLGAVAPGNDLLRGLGYDGDWIASNNEAHLTKFDALASVGWAVAETQSHFFIHYVYTWPRRTSITGQLGYDNDTAGATVVVRRYPTEQPVALETWFKRPNDERRWLWVTSDSGLVPAGKKPSAVNVRAVLPVDTLFPKATDSLGCAGKTGCTPRRFAAFLTGSTHQSCLWPDLGEKSAGVCATDTFSKGAMSLIRYVPGLKATPALATGGKPGATPSASLPTFTYELTSVFDTWFPRRASPDLFVKPMTFIYKAPAGRPTGQKLAIGSQLLGGSSDFGRPPWAWRWKPANNDAYYDLPRGTVFFDPAHALWQRIGGTSAGLATFDPTTKAGLSLGYCFAPFLFIDQRELSACKGSLSAP